MPESGCCCSFVPLFFISSVSFLFNFQTLKFFVALSSETVRPIKLTLDTHVDNGWMYRVYRNQAAASYLSLYFFVSNVRKLKIFVALFSGTVRPKKFKLGTLVDNGWMYRVYQNQAAAAYLSLFLSLQLSNIYNLRHIFLRNCEAYKVEAWYKCGQSVHVLCIQKLDCCCLFVALLVHFSFSPIVSCKFVFLL